MRTLFLDLASHEGLIAVCSDDAVLAANLIDHRMRDHDLIPALEALMDAAGCKLQQLDRIACAQGPGGFTSLRVAVSAANAFADQLDVPLAGFHLSDLWKDRAPSSGPTGHLLPKGEGHADFLWLHSTKRTELFVRGFGSYATRWPDATHRTLEVLLAELPADARFTGELLSEHREAVLGRGLVETAAVPVADILSSFISTLKYGRTSIQPWYGREG